MKGRVVCLPSGGDRAALQKYDTNMKSIIIFQIRSTGNITPL